MKIGNLKEAHKAVEKGLAIDPQNNCLVNGLKEVNQEIKELPQKCEEIKQLAYKNMRENKLIESKQLYRQVIRLN